MSEGEIGSYCSVQVLKMMAGEPPEPTDSDLRHESAGRIEVKTNQCGTQHWLQLGYAYGEAHVCKHCGSVYWVAS